MLRLSNKLQNKPAIQSLKEKTDKPAPEFDTRAIDVPTVPAVSHPLQRDRNPKKKKFKNEIIWKSI